MSGGQGKPALQAEWLMHMHTPLEPAPASPIVFQQPVPEKGVREGLVRGGGRKVERAICLDCNLPAGVLPLHCGVDDGGGG